MITVGGPFANIKYENGMELPKLNFIAPLVPLGDGDRYRTAAVQVNVGPIGMGTNMITGDPGPRKGERETFKEKKGHDIYIKNTVDGFEYDPDTQYT